MALHLCKVSVWTLLLWLIQLGNCIHSASVIGFHDSFISSSKPYNIIECDSSCTSPGSVKVALIITRTGDLSVTDTVFVSTRTSTLTDTIKPATSGVDYTPITKLPVLFFTGESQKNVELTIISDGIYEENEQLEVVLEDPSAGVTISNTNKIAYINIQDGGDAGIFSFSASTYSFLENAQSGQVKILRSGGSNGQVTVQYRLANPNQATGSYGKDFLFVDSSLQVDFEDGQKEGILNINIINDELYEQEFEHFEIQLASVKPSYAKLSTQNSHALIKILDDGDAGEFNFAASSIYCREDNGSAVVRISRTKGKSTLSFLPIKLVVETIKADGNATEGQTIAADYVGRKETLIWEDGETDKFFSIKIFNNNRYQPQTRAIKVKISQVDGGATIGSVSQMWVYIFDDRDAGTLSFKKSHYEFLENEIQAVVEILRTGPQDLSNINKYSSGVISVEVSTYGGVVKPNLDPYDSAYDYDIVKTRGCTHVSPCTATPGEKYTPLSTTKITFADGEISKTVNIPLINNNLFESPDQVFKVIMQNVQGGAHIGFDFEHPPEWIPGFLSFDKKKGSPTVSDYVSTLVSIRDDNDPAVIVSKISISTSELGHTDEFSINLNSQPTANVLVTLVYDKERLDISSDNLKFDSINWNIPQVIKIRALGNNHSMGIDQVDISFECSSTDTYYNGQLRKNLASPASGFTIGAKVFTQKWGIYETGNELHEFRWEEKQGVLTSPLQEAVVHGFVFDRDQVGVHLFPETVRHRKKYPKGFVSIRENGHNATMSFKLMSKPTASSSATISFVPFDSSVGIEPVSIIISSAEWNETKTVLIYAVLDKSKDNSSISHSNISVLYDGKDVNSFLVERYPTAQVLLDTSEITAQENGANSKSINYSVKLASKPMYWSPVGATYEPFELILAPTADTTVVNPPIKASGKEGKNSKLYAASNASTSTQIDRLEYVSSLRFNLSNVRSITGSPHVGLAILRLFRLSGGENGGFGGINVGVLLGNITSDWNESALAFECQATCKIVDSYSKVEYPNMYPTASYQDLHKHFSAESLIETNGTFDSVNNQYKATNGWVEIDVTVLINQFFGENSEEKDLSVTFFVYTRPTALFIQDKVDEVVFASKEHTDILLRPQLQLLASGKVNLALTASVRQSDPGSATAAIDGKRSSTNGVASTFSMSSTIYQYSWWEADLKVPRLIDEIVVVIKKKVPSTWSSSILGTKFWIFLSNKPLGVSNSNGNKNGGTATGFKKAKEEALFSKQFNVNTRSTSAEDSESIIFRWKVYGQEGSTFGNDRFISNFSNLVEAQYVLIQVEGENNLALNEVEIYQQPMAEARLALGGYLPSPSMKSPKYNQFQYISNQERYGEVLQSEDCNTTTGLCRAEVRFTPDDWNKEKNISFRVFDDPVATGDRTVLLTHTLVGPDPDFIGSSVCRQVESDVASFCNRSLFNESSVKPLKIIDDDESKIIISKSVLNVAEGSFAFPSAPRPKRDVMIIPKAARCSGNPDVSVSLDDCNSDTSCAVAFKQKKMTSLTLCATKVGASSGWMIADLGEVKNITKIQVVIAPAVNSLYVKSFSIWKSSKISLMDSEITENSFGKWEMVQTFKSSQMDTSKSIEFMSLNASFAQVLLFSFDSSYDTESEGKTCITLPQIQVTVYDPVMFPLPNRGDLEDPNSLSVQATALSRMHLLGQPDVIQFKLTSEPVQDVIVSVSQILNARDETSDAFVVYEPRNLSVNQQFLTKLIGGNYPERGDRFPFYMPSKLKFTQDNWNETQELLILAIDDNDFNGNRGFTLSIETETNDNKFVLYQSPSFNGTDLIFSDQKIQSSKSYKQAPFFTTSGRNSKWPFHYNDLWSSSTGSVSATLIDDDLPGVTLSQSQVIADEGGPAVNYSVSLDSAPQKDVTVRITFEKDDSLFTINPTELTFSRSKWWKPSYVVIQATQNEIHDAAEPVTLQYTKTVAKIKKPILKHLVRSMDPRYNGIPVGTNEYDRKKIYVINQGIQLIIRDDDTGCRGEYTCANGGVCITNQTGINFCSCAPNFGLKNCSGECENARDCNFDRVEFLLRCVPDQEDAVCSSTFSASKLASSLYRLLTEFDFASPSGQKYEKLTLGPLAEALYVVNNTRSKCLHSEDTCQLVIVDIAHEGDDKLVTKKLQALHDSGSFQGGPFFAELMAEQNIQPQSLGATIAVWFFIGFCCASLMAVIGLLTARYVKMRRSLVKPQLNEEENPSQRVQLPRSSQ